MARAEFQRVIVGASYGGLQCVAAEVRPQRPAGSVDLPSRDGIVDRVFSVCAAGKRAGQYLTGLAETQTECGIASIRLDENALMMARRTDVAGAQDGIRAGLALDRKHPLFGIGRLVVDVVAGNTADGFKVGPVEVYVRMAARRVQWGECVRERLAVVLAIRGGHEWSGEEWWRGTGVCRAIGCIGRQNSD